MFGGPPEYVIRAMRGKLNASLRMWQFPDWLVPFFWDLQCLEP
jgi:hypothetical protein